ncbi:O-linked N-acetylglucosamine transferase, SPINDLY family protein [Stieleria maiorica]|uniref:O-linked N-acetylglucosamine transferase, SPINDLY family protein n=1 Tax=Stieleria maiorica TaxID=2795974 RepID=UPI00142F3189|nr:tetratricopeptide repeat protein [Stieleria maiorica]
MKIENALAMQRAGNLEQAKQLYCEVLSVVPDHADAWHLLGMTLYSAGAYPSALECLEKARGFMGDQPELISNLAIVYHSAGDARRAHQMLHQVIEADPENSETRNNLGVFLLESGHLEQAEQQFQRAIRIDPQSEQAAMNLANCWVRQNRLHDAEQVYHDLVQRNPGNLDVLGNLGECYRRQCKWEESLELLQRVVHCRPGDVVSKLTLARTLVNLGRLPEAAERFEQLVIEFPDNAKAHHYLGTVLLSLRDVARAKTEIRRALELDPTDAHALCSLGFVYIESDRRREAAECFAEAVKRDPRMSSAHGCLLYLMSGDPEISPEQLFEEHIRWGERHGNVQPIRRHTNRPDRERKLRIGYASADFREHAVTAFFEPLLRLRDRSMFEVYCYYESGVGDNVTERLKSLADHWRVTLGYSDQQVAQQIADDQIDILVDLAGHTSGNRLPAFATKPAPIQISWLGYPNTTGLQAIDYCLTCDVQNPIGEPTLHTEELIRIPGGSFCFAPPKNAPDVSSLPAAGKGYVTLGSLHRPFKISSTTHDLWAAALKACPNSKLLAFNTRFNEPLKAELISALAQRGISESRIEVRSTYRGDSYLETYHEIDIGLDATPWAGGTTTMEALWMGIPVIGFYGNNRPSRGTAGIVHHLGKPEWIARTTDQYASLVGSLAGDLESLAEIRRSLRELTRQTIADQQRFVTELQNAYRQVWQRWCVEQSVSGVTLLPKTMSASPPLPATDDCT